MHTSCIDPWVQRQNASCPVCKKSLNVDDDNQSSSIGHPISNTQAHDGGTIVDVSQLSA